MDFQLKDYDIIEEDNHQYKSESAPTQSAILDELTKENEDLQNKLKLNYRRLLLFETENNKLNEEKNALYFQAKTQVEKAHLLEEKNIQYEKENKNLLSELAKLNEKTYALEKINYTQLNEIKRFSKFHLKIQNVVKPYILQLKKSLTTTQNSLTQAIKQIEILKISNQDLDKKLKTQIDKNEKMAKIFQIDKNNFIQNYEEQIHSFSKEILDQQIQNENLTKEVARLKKSIEFKNYYENELIKFKRIHEEESLKNNQLVDLKNSHETQILNLESSLSIATNELNRTKTQLDEKDYLLENTRKQLSKQIDETNQIHERLNRLEKLNNQLSREMTCSL